MFTLQDVHINSALERYTHSLNNELNNLMCDVSDSFGFWNELILISLSLSLGPPNTKQLWLTRSPPRTFPPLLTAVTRVICCNKDCKLSGYYSNWKVVYTVGLLPPCTWSLALEYGALHQPWKDQSLDICRIDKYWNMSLNVNSWKKIYDSNENRGKDTLFSGTERKWILLFLRIMNSIF